MSSAGSDASLHIGRIVDPDVREDGELEPSVELGVPIGSVDPAVPQLQPLAPVPPTVPGSEALEAKSSTPTGDGVPTPPVEPDLPSLPSPRAAPSGAERTSQSDSQPGENASRAPRIDFEGLVEDESQPRRSRDLELDQVGAGLLSRPRGNSLPPPPKSPMSPRLVAVFGAAMGVLVVATIIAIAMRLDRAELPGEPVASETPAASARAPSVEEKAPEAKKRARAKVPGPYRIKDSANDPQLRVVEGQIGFEPFLKAVEKAGVPLKEAYRLLVAFEKVRPLNNCARSDRFAAAIDRSSKRIKAFEYITGPEEVFQAKESANGLLVAEKLDLRVKRERVTGSFLVRESGLERSVTEGAFEPQLLRSMREALIGHLSLEEIERGSRVRVIAQEVTALGEFARYAGIEALEILFPAEKKRLRVYFFNGAKSRGFFDETARAPYEGGWRTPIPNAPVTSRFNMHRMHPVLHKVMPHTGVDFGAAMGVPIGATSFGTITFIGWGGPTGNFVRVQHASGYESGYAHMSRFAEGLKVGDKVKRLQTLGYVGSTGRSTGPHLHFTIKKDGKFIDPLSLNLDALRVLPSDEREVFLQHKAQYDAQLDAIELPALPKSVAAAAGSAEPASEGFEEEGSENEPSASAAPSAPPPAAGPAESPSASPGAKQNGSALYLTDDELMRMQKSSESGEVEE
ncbi:MAG: peptidoglycan DD-metalloendopeptidase family protein [Myxococcales bacterium]